MRRLDPIKLSFAASGTATGVISNGVSYFLLIYYSQVLGLNPEWAGLAMMIALLVDAVSDPLVGRWSDRLQSRWGRRHPFLFVCVLPVGLVYFALWHPPELGQLGLFVYLLVFIVLLRLSTTLHSVPFNALLPELTDDYDRRTSLMNWSYSAAWFFGTLIAVVMYAYWLADDPGSAPGSGALRREGYAEAGWVTAAIASLAMGYAAWRTWGYRNHLHAPAPAAETMSQFWRQAWVTLNDRNFLVLALSGLFSAIASGTSTALWAYMQPYFWGFDSEQTSALLFSQLFSPVLAFVLLPWVSRGRDKRQVMITLSAASLVVGSGPVLAWLMGWFPADPELTYTIVLLAGVCQVMLIVMTGVVFASMLADLVEARALVTGRREEGLLLSVVSFVSKVATGAGVWVGGLILAIIDFPSNTLSSAVADQIAFDLGLWYGPVLAVFYLLAIVALLAFRLDRIAHEANIAALNAAKE